MPGCYSDQDKIFLNLQPPGSARWNLHQGRKHKMLADDFILKTAQDFLPPGCSLVRYNEADWNVCILENLHADLSSWKKDVEEIVLGSESRKSIPEKLESASHYDNKDKHGSEKMVNLSEREKRGVVMGLNCCSTNSFTSEYVAAITTVICGLPNDIVSEKKYSFDWPSFLEYSYRLLWDSLDNNRKNLIVHEFQEMLMSFDEVKEYGNGEKIWGFSSKENNELKELYNCATNSTADFCKYIMNKCAPLHKQALLIKPIVEKSDDFPQFIEKFGSVYGWEPKLESMSNPIFSFFVKSIEMGIPVLAQRREDERWVVIAGYKESEIKEELMILNFKDLSSESALIDLSEKDHRAIMSLPDYAPGKKDYINKLRGGI